MKSLTNFSDTSVKMYAVPDSAGSLGKPSVTTQFFQKSLVTNETYLIDCGVPGIVFADTNDSIQMWHLSQTTISYAIYGGEET